MQFFPYQAHYHPLSTPTMLTLFSSIYDVGTVGAVLSTINTNIYLNQYHPPSLLSLCWIIKYFLADCDDVKNN